jgi:mannose-6-phosphate isomerase-like protein (cupin superfamily)
VTWERLTFWADEDVEFIEATYAPGGASGPGGALVRHGGREFGHVISGTLHAVVGFDKFVLGPGDSITFPSSTPHRFGNEGSEPARAIWVVRGRREAQLGHEASFTGRHFDDQPTAVQHR